MEETAHEAPRHPIFRPRLRIERESAQIDVTGGECRAEPRLVRDLAVFEQEVIKFYRFYDSVGELDFGRPD
eukprot:1468586-Pleurochrysis_carterae.AAC.1